MMKFVIALLVATELFAQGTFPTKQIPTDYDALTYDLQFDLVHALKTTRAQRGRRKVEPNVNITFKLLRPADHIALDANDLEIDAVTMDDEAVGYDTLTPNTLTIRFASTLDTGVVHKLTILYALLHDNRGFNALAPEDDTAKKLLEPQVFTFSEPEDARWWFPCHDTPSDKALFSVMVRTPKGFRSTSNGVRISDLVDSDTTHVERWRQSEPMPTYLVVMNASRYLVYDQVYRRTATDTVPIKSYQWAADFKNDSFDVAATFENVPRMFSTLERLFGRYPFSTYGHTAIAPVNFGGMEHSSMTSIARVWLKADAEIGVVHELGHQWLGDLVTCATWADLWMNEGGASFVEALWMEELLGRGGYLGRLMQRRGQYMKKGLEEPPVYDQPMWALFNDATTYCKGSWIYHMIRQMVGDTVFFNSMHTYFTENARKSLQTADVVAFWKRQVPNPLVPWDTYFDQWLVKQGHPVMSIAIVKNDHQNGRFDYTFVVNQTQVHDNVPEAFVFPLRVRIARGDSVREDRIVITQRTQSFMMYNTFDGDITVDPYQEVLCQKDTAVTTDVVMTGANEGPRLTVIGALPHARRTELQVVCRGLSTASTLRLTDMSGALVDETSVSPDNTLATFNTSALAPGAYNLSVRANATTISSTIVIAP